MIDFKSVRQRRFDATCQTDGLSARSRRWALAALWAAVAMSVLDGTLVNVALPTISRSLDLEPARAIWILNAYQLAIVASLLPLSALGQIVTFRRVFLSGLTLFVVSSVACVISQSLPQLVCARAIQGLGAAGIMSSSGALLRHIFPSAQLGRAVGLNAMVIAGSAAIGPSFASAILAVGPWPYLFAINVPVGLIALILAWFALPVTPRADYKLDLVATALNVATFGMLVIGVDILIHGGRSVEGSLLFAMGLGAGWLLVARSRSQLRPLVPLDLLRNFGFSLAIVTSVASFTAQMLAYVALPFLFQSDLHLDLTQTGLVFCAWPAAAAMTAPIAGRLSDKVPSGLLAGIGLAILAIGLFLLSSLTRNSSHVTIMFQMALCGLGFGLFQSPNNRELLGTAPEERAGAAGGILAVARLTGQTGGTALAAALFATTMQGPLWCLRFAMVAAAIAATIGFIRRGVNGQRGVQLSS